MSFVDACGNDLVERLFADHWLVMIVSDLSDILFKTSASSRDLHLQSRNDSARQRRIRFAGGYRFVAKGV